MEIKFSNDVTGQIKTELLITKIESGVFIDVFYLKENNEDENLTHFLNKDQLKDFIGVLLHVQSKLRGGNNG